MWLGVRLRKRLLSCERRWYLALQRRADRRIRRLTLRAGGKPVPQHLLTGQRGEDEAFFWLLSHGYTVVARRWRSERLRGDLELVAWDGATLVIFEVKTLTAAGRAEAFAPAERQVDRDKQRMLRRMAAAYRRQMPERWRDSVPVRFDVVSVYLPDRAPSFEHFREAFSPVE